MRLSCHSLGQQRLTGTGRSDKQTAFGQLGADLGIFIRMFQEFHRFLQRFLRLVLAGNILEGDACLGLHIHLRTALSDSHHSACAGHPAQHNAHQDPDQDQRRKAQDDVQDQAGCVVRNLLLKLYVRLVQPLYKIGIRHPACVVGHLDSLACQ